MSARRSLLAALVAVATILVPVSRSASADTTSDQAKLKQIATQLAQLDQQNSQLDDDLLAAQQDAAQAKADVAATQAKVADLQQQLGIVQQHVSELALNTFASGDSSGSLGALLGDPTKLTSTVEKDQYTKLAFSDGQDSIDELGAGVDELNKQQALLVKQQQIAEAKTALVTTKQSQLADKSDALQKLQSDTEAQFGKDQVAEAEAAQAAALQEAQASAAQAKAAKSGASGASNTSGSSGSSGASGTSGDSGSSSGSGGSGSSDGSTSGTASGTTTTKSGGSGTPTTTSPPKGTSGGGSSGSSGGSSGAGHSVPAPAPGASGAVAAALSQIGVPYHYAMSSPGVGFDCSGLTSWAWGQAGRSIPHQSAQQYASLPHISQADVQPGDLLFYYSPISHVAMYIGGGQFVDAPNTGKTVRTGAVNWGSVVGIARP